MLQRNLFSVTKFFPNSVRRPLSFASSRSSSRISFNSRSVVTLPPSVFPDLCGASAALREACERSGTPRDAVERALDQVRGAREAFPSFEVTRVHVFTPPPPESRAGPHAMLLFRGTPDLRIESRLAPAVGETRPPPLAGGGRLFFTSALRVAMPYGRVGPLRREYRILLCRIERQPGTQLLNRTVASEEELQLLESVEGNMRRFKDGTYDGQVDWLDGGATYCFDANDVRMHTLMCIDIQC